MKTTNTSKTNTRSRIIFFAIVLIYNLLLGLYLKDFLVLSPILLTFYLLSSVAVLIFRHKSTVNAYAGGCADCSIFRHGNEYC